MSARMVLLGPPGAGKGTQAARISERLSIPAISTGDIFRANVAGATELGLKAKEYMDKGEYVPDSVTNAMVADRIAADDAASGFLLDGYPRTEAQVHELDAMLAAKGLALDVVLEITADAAPLSRTAPTTPSRSFAAALRSTPSRPSRWPPSTRPRVSSCASTASATSTRSPSAS